MSFQGTNDSNAFWDMVSHILKDPSPEQEACHAPKPILLDTGEVRILYSTATKETHFVIYGRLMVADYRL